AGAGIAAWLAWFDGGGQASLQAAGAAIAAPGPSAAQTWSDFLANASPYYAWLDGLVGPLEDPTAANGFLSDDLVAEINAFELDQSLISVSLRAYQSFGSRFALVQKRVIIGDEMGLGKTVQGLAAMAHLRAQGSSHFLVVCPASVIINWHRELERYSELTVWRLHGDDRPGNIALWRDQGGVAITTFDSLHTIPRTDEVTIAMLVVDEAHFIKNPETRRARYSRQWIGLSERVLFLSGTPMENRVEEFSNLVDYLRPDVARTLDPGIGVAGADAFRRAVSTVYLRRNQSDVLKELPELVEIDEWEEFSARDQQHYNDAVLAGNFMAMRQAGFAEPQYSAKLERLLEIVDEAAETGLKVVVFSFFRGTLDAVAGALAARAFGPITGDVNPVKRQELVDSFSAAPPGAVLVCQIQAGGVGLNIQAASVVVLCEPQLKPSSEQQAIARAHRMGQVRRVQVHRLLTADSVDQRLLEILSTKSDLFDQYARRSEIADSAPEARDTSTDGGQARLAQRIVAAEQARLAGLAPTEPAATAPDPEPAPDPVAGEVLPAQD
ncbi:MAG: DEAD/DEAH box helicase, partial [Actinomycetes bacterium]